MADDPTQRDADTVQYEKFAGLRNDVGPERFGPADLAVANNVDLDVSGGVSRRAGRIQKVPGATHSLWADDQQTICLFVQSNVLYSLNSDYTKVALTTLISNAQVSFTKVNDLVFFSNGSDTGVIEQGAVRSWGVAPPTLPSCDATVGALSAGTYRFTMTFSRADGSESGAPQPALIQVGDGAGLSFTNLPVSADPSVSIKNLYLSPPNGEELFLAIVLDNTTTAALYAGDATELNLPIDTLLLQPAPAGQIVAFYRSRMWVAVGDLLCPSKPFAYEWFDPRDFIELDGQITLLAPMTDKELYDSGRNSGFFVGTDRSCGIISGGSPEEFQYVPKMRYGAVPGTLAYVDGALYQGGETTTRDLPMWTTAQGVCIGLPNLDVKNLTRTKYGFPVGQVGAAIYMPNPNRYIATSRSPNAVAVVNPTTDGNSGAGVGVGSPVTVGGAPISGGSTGGSAGDPVIVPPVTSSPGDTGDGSVSPPTDPTIPIAPVESGDPTDPEGPVTTTGPILPPPTLPTPPVNPTVDPGNSIEDDMAYNFTAGVHQITANTLLSGPQQIEFGAVLQVVAPAKLQLVNVTWITSDYNPFIDLSLGGTIYGNLLNDYESVCWYGADATGNNPSGPAFDKAMRSTLTAFKRVPMGSYKMKNQQLYWAFCHLTGPDFASARASRGLPYLYWDTDLGAAGDPLTSDRKYIYAPGIGVAPGALPTRKMSKLQLQFNTIKPIQYVTAPQYNTDGIVLGEGNGGDVKVEISDMIIMGARFGIVGNTTTGHSRFARIKSNYNYSLFAFIHTGGDWRINDIEVGNNQLSMMYAWANTGAEQDLIVDEGYVAYTPYVLYQPAALHPNVPSSAIPAFTVGGLFRGIWTEFLGNSFMILQGGLNSTIMENCQWDINPAANAGNSSFRNLSLPQDYAIDVAFLSHCVMKYGKDFPGVGTFFSPGAKGVIRGTQQMDVNVSGFIGAPTGKSFITTPANYSSVIPIGYKPPEVVIQAGTNTTTTPVLYTLSLDECASLYYMNSPEVICSYTANGADRTIVAWVDSVNVPTATAGGGVGDGTYIGTTMRIKLSGVPAGMMAFKMKLHSGLVNRT